MFPALAAGHARLAGSEPADGTVLEHAPAEVVLDFSERVAPASLNLVALDSERLSVPLEAAVSERRLRVPLPEQLPAGRYALDWRVLARDGHVVSGSFAFSIRADRPVMSPHDDAASVGAADEAVPLALAEWSADTAAAGEVPPWHDDTGTGRRDLQVLAWVARAVFLVLLLVAAGQALFAALLPVPAPLATDVHRSVARLALCGLPAALLHLQTTGMLGLGGAGLLDPAALQLAARSSVALSLAVAIPGMLLLAWSGRRGGAGPLLAGAMLLLLSRALTGHPVSREPGWLLMPAMVVHAGCAAWWYGSLWPLRRALADLPPAAAAELVRRFSSLALAAVALLAFVGLMMALVHLSAPAALTGTDYGRLLLAKLSLFLLLLVMAGWHRSVLTPRLARGDARAAAGLRIGIALEVVVMSLLLLTSAAVTGSAPDLPAGGFWR